LNIDFNEAVAVNAAAFFIRKDISRYQENRWIAFE